MKQKIKKFLSILFSVLLVTAMFQTGGAVEARASNYFWVTEVWATASGSGNIIVEFDIGATHTMTEVGATKIVIKEKQSDGSYDTVKTFTRYNTSGLIEKNSSCAYAKVTYAGKSGTKYYAVATLYAKDSSGSETMYQTSNTITA